jgi:hypothetical protein
MRLRCAAQPARTCRACTAKFERGRAHKSASMASTNAGCIRAHSSDVRSRCSNSDGCAIASVALTFWS